MPTKIGFLHIMENNTYPLKDDLLANLPRIEENALYRAADLEALVGVATLRKLRSLGGLRAVGDWYTGRMVLGGFERAAVELSRCQRVSEGKEENVETRHAKGSVAKASGHKKVQPVPGHKGGSDIRSQLEESKRLVREASIQR